MQGGLTALPPLRDDGGSLFAVVIPTYNQADLLAIALRSVFAQTFQRFEVIVVDNHSPDHTAEVVASFADPRLRFTQVRNRGVIALSRNVGIRQTRAPLVAFLDSDDVWYPAKLDRVRAAFGERPDAGLVCHDEDVTRDGRIVRRNTYGPWVPGMYRSLIERGSLLSPSATVVRRECIERAGPFSEDPMLAGVEDHDLWLRLSRVCEFHFLHEPLGEFRLHARSTSVLSGTHLAHSLHLLVRHEALAREWGERVPKAAFDRRRAALNAAAARGASRWLGADGALAYAVRAIGHAPRQPTTYARVAANLGRRLLRRAP